MSNFIFKSQWTFKKINNKLEIIQAELRHARADHVAMLALIHRLVTDKELQTTVDNYFDKDETSPQTDSEEQ